MHTRATVALFTLAALLLGGCYTTKVHTGAIAAGPEIRDRQWFTIGGLIPLSESTGLQCPGGLARAESQVAGMDIVLNVALALVGGGTAAVLCRNESKAERNSCFSAGASLVPFLFASRTVRYTCAGPGPAPGTWSPPPVQAPPAPYQPPPPPPGSYQPPPAPLPPPPPPPGTAS